MKNQPCYDKNGKFLGWFSRSNAVVCVTFAKDLDGIVYVLASDRGEGTPDPEFVGAWNLVCGYLDFNETLEEAATAASEALEARVGSIPADTTIQSYIDTAVGSGGTASANAIATAKQEAIETSNAYTDEQITNVYTALTVTEF